MTKDLQWLSCIKCIIKNKDKTLEELKREYEVLKKEKMTTKR